MNLKLSLLILLILLVPTIFAQTTLTTNQNLGTFAQNQLINITQYCSNATQGIVEYFILPDSTPYTVNTIMTRSNNLFSYPFNNSNQLGGYLVYGNCNGVSWQYGFGVTPDGTIVTGSAISFYIFILLILGVLIYYSFYLSASFNKNKSNEYDLYKSTGGNRFLFFMSILKNKIYILGIFGIYIFLIFFVMFFGKITILLNIEEFYLISKYGLLLLSWGLIPFTLFWIGYLIMVVYNGAEQIFKYQFGGYNRR